jgi:hypothetical protein
VYRPNFCAECGERVARARWRLWTSRRFCAPCARRLGRRRFVAPLALAAALAGACFLLGRAGRPTAQPSPPVERGTLKLSPAAVGAAPEGRKPEPRRGPDGSDTERPTEPGETVSICGARTKKGTPCQRRVRGAGRCWQHRGKPAILPPSKLVVPE